MGRIKRFIKKLYNIITKPEMKVLPGHLAFFIVLSIIPIITLIGLTATMFHVPLTNLINIMNDVLPSGVSDILLPFINGNSSVSGTWILILTGFIIASNGAHSIIITSNTLYGIEHSGYLKRRIKALFLTILLIILLIFNLLVVAFGNYILHAILNLSFFSSINNQIFNVFLLFKWPVALLFIFLIVKMIYTIAPDDKIPSKYTNRGSIFTTIGWSLATVIYSYYVTNFTNYNLFYGSLTNIIVMMIWIYILSFILVIGIAINTNTYQIIKKQSDKIDKKET